MTDALVAAHERDFAVAIDRGRPLRLIIVQPLFDEANRTRRMLAQAMRSLDALGIDTIMPDLPGCGESLVPLEAVTMDNWREAVASWSGRFGAIACLSLRGGALIDDAASQRIARLSPVDGRALIRPMLRARMAAAREQGVTENQDSLVQQGRTSGIDLNGHRLSPELFRAIEGASPAAVPGALTLRLDEDGKEADRRIAGSPLWLRAEPGEDGMLSAALAGTMAEWLAT